MKDMWFCVVLALSTLSCKHVFPVPYTVQQLQRDSSRWPGDAFVHYLSQPNADLAVCTVNGPALLTRLDDDLAHPFVDALENGALQPERWQACGTRFLPTLPPQTRDSAYARLARVIMTLLGVETSAPQLIAANEVLSLRPREPSPAMTELSRRLQAQNPQSLHPSFGPVFDALRTTLELDSGQWRGKPLTEDDIVNAQDESLLMRMSHRLPTEAFRLLAKQRLIRLRIDRSAFSEVKRRANEVEEAVMRYGRWALPAATLTLEHPELPMTLPLTLLAQQDVDAQRVSIFSSGETGAQVIPAIDLKPTLRFAVGLSQPVALCDGVEALNVEPCIASRDVQIPNPQFRLDEEGVLRLGDTLSMPAAFELALQDAGFVVPVHLGGRLALSLQIPVQFNTPEPVIFEAETEQPGPALTVAVVPTHNALLFDVTDGSTRRMVVYPRESAPNDFAVVSRGGRGVSGYQGQTGFQGYHGAAGANASCSSRSAGQNGQRGGDGGQGGPGGPGGNGANGGAVYVDVRCGGTCPQDAAWVRRLVRSEGGFAGDGGRGGNGGPGGNGGAGGSSASCNQPGAPSYLSGGSSGHQGSTGPRGPSGQPGRPGASGPVSLQVH
jgi:hypothetical protein